MIHNTDFTAFKKRTLYCPTLYKDKSTCLKPTKYKFQKLVYNDEGGILLANTYGMRTFFIQSYRFCNHHIESLKVLVGFALQILLSN